MRELIYKDEAVRAVLHNEGQAAVVAIESIEAVDAVPVEWINGFMDWLDNKGYVMCSAVIQKMMNDFRNEGEQKDGDRK